VCEIIVTSRNHVCEGILHELHIEIVCVREGEMFERRPKLFKDRDVLSPLFVPDTLQDRKIEVEEISQYLGYALDGATPPHLLIVGPSGSGKTVCVKYVLKEMGKCTDILVNYAVADGTAYQIITLLARNSGCRIPLKGMGFTEILSKFKEKIENERVIVVLDEIDKTLARDGTKLLYHLSRCPRVCILGLSNKLTVTEMIDDLRVLSSFKPRKIGFSPYNAVQLREILEYRAERAFHPGVLEDDVIPLCAAIAAQRNGDARYALDLLAFAADVSIRKEKDRVTAEEVRFAKDEVETEFIRRSIERLGQNQKILLYCVLTAEENTPTSVYRRYNKIAEEWGSSPLTQRRLSELLKELELFGLVEIERRGRGRGRGVDWRLFPPSTIEKRVLMEAIRRSL